MEAKVFSGYCCCSPAFIVFFFLRPLGDAGEEGSVVGDPFLIAFFLPGLLGYYLEGSFLSLMFVCEAGLENDP